MNQSWRRTSPVAVVFYLIRALKFLVTDGLAMLAPAVAWFATVSGGMKIWAFAWLGLIVVGGAIWAVMTYLRFRYRITDNQVLVRRGVLTREQLNIDFDRIQDTSIDEPFYVRPFGLAVLKLDTAGSAKKEIALAGIRIEMANEIRQTLLAFQPHQTATVASTEGLDTDIAPVGAKPLLVRSTRQIVRYGMTSNGLLWVAIMFGVMAGAFGDESWKAGSNFLLNRLQIGSLFDGDGVSKGLVVAGLLLGIPLLLSLFSVIGALWKFANYELFSEAGSFRRSSGLVSRQQQTLKRTKVQAAVWKQNAMARLLKITNLQMRLVSAGQEVNSNGMPNATPAFVVPALNAQELVPMTREFLPDAPQKLPAFSGIQRRYHLKRCLWMWLLPVAGLTISLAIATGLWALLALPVGLLLAMATSWQRSGKFGVCIINGTGYLRSGFIGTQTTVFSLFKVQRVDLNSSAGQRRRGLATLHVHLASHSISIPHLPLQQAQQFADLALYQAESTTAPWF